MRVIAASNRDLKTESEAGRFRLDLYYRLSVIQIDMPPLRERGDDVILLAQHYVASFSERLRIRIHGLLPEVADAFRSYEWPGNVRELRNVIERALILEDGEMITIKYLPRNLLAPDAQSTGADPALRRTGAADEFYYLPPEGVSLDDLETSLVRQAMTHSGGNQTRAAELLGISRDQLRYRLKKIDIPSAEAAS